jgi:hypothetical protein
MRYLPLLILLTLSLALKAQEYKDTIARDYTAYLNAIQNQEYAKALDYMVPEMFELVSKQEMIAMMEKTMKDTMMEFKITHSVIDSIGDAIVVNSTYYARIDHSYTLHIGISAEKEETAEEKKARVAIYLSVFKNAFGQDVKYNWDTDYFETGISKPAFAVSTNGETAWKFVVAEKGDPILPKILPQEMIDTL